MRPDVYKPSLNPYFPNNANADCVAIAHCQSGVFLHLRVTTGHPRYAAPRSSRLDKTSRAPREPLLKIKKGSLGGMNPSTLTRPLPCRDPPPPLPRPRPTRTRSSKIATRADDSAHEITKIIRGICASDTGRKALMTGVNAHIICGCVGNCLTTTPLV
jgi:hypothetical protein